MCHYLSKKKLIFGIKVSCHCCKHNPQQQFILIYEVSDCLPALHLEFLSSGVQEQSYSECYLKNPNLALSLQEKLILDRFQPSSSYELLLLNTVMI